ncbi:ParB/RepB/Spo0J family partition protein [Streptomyces sp. NPDC057052]|uniref:ParB/RepB/Spo0J family partition protein n=1 Tax=Streptomyces sp. NPDC057052 TaxID=3346010 RepID=UPI003635C51A
MGTDVLAHIAECRRAVRRSPIVTVPVEALIADDSPRVSGVDDERVRALAETETAHPPIVVHRPTMRVIDGAHRLRAAKLRGLTHIEVRFFEGAPDDAFVLAVAANATHGLPLSRADRLAAAARILGRHPDWSDRAVASVTGLSAKKVAEIRREYVAGEGAPAVRVGRDGRRRPVDRARGRELAGELIRADPGASLRQIAQVTGISPSTAADVRDRVRQGRDPVPERVRAERDGHAPDQRSAGAGAGTGADGAVLHRSRTPVDLLSTFNALCRDPSLRLTDTGRALLRLFDSCAALARESGRIVDSIPAHRREQVAELLLGHAELSRRVARELCE